MMKITKSASIKGYANKKHKFEIERSKMSGYEFVTVKKNGNKVIICEANEFKKLQKLFAE